MAALVKALVSWWETRWPGKAARRTAHSIEPDYGQATRSQVTQKMEVKVPNPLYTLDRPGLQGDPCP